jgi:hypothetical protein
MDLPMLDQHLDIEIRAQNIGELIRIVDVLIETDTCFAVIGGESRVRMHERGLKALKEAGLV